MGKSVIINKNQFKQSADTVTFDIPIIGEKKQEQREAEGDYCKNIKRSWSSWIRE